MVKEPSKPEHLKWYYFYLNTNVLSHDLHSRYNTLCLFIHLVSMSYIKLNLTSFLSMNKAKTSNNLNWNLVIPENRVLYITSFMARYSIALFQITNALSKIEYSARNPITVHKSIDSIRIMLIQVNFGLINWWVKGDLKWKRIAFFKNQQRCGTIPWSRVRAFLKKIQIKSVWERLKMI